MVHESAGQTDGNKRAASASWSAREQYESQFGPVPPRGVPLLESYTSLASFHSLSRVNHQRGEYVRGKAQTNSIESVWALVKLARS